MRIACLVVLLAGCSPSPEFDTTLAERPVDYQAPPGAQGLTLEGPSVVEKGGTYTWTVTASDLVPGEQIDLGWGGRLGAGPCPYPQLVGVPLCLDVTRPARLLASETAVPHPTIPGQGIATFTFTVPPRTPRAQVYLQAFKLDGPLSATSAALGVGIVDPCQPAGLPLGGGDGTEFNPYQLCAPAHLANLAGLSNAHVMQMADIDLAGSGVDGIAMGPACHIDGNGYTLDGYDGTFGLFASDCHFRDITMTNIAMDIPAPTLSDVGPLIGVSFDGSFESISTEGSITVDGSGVIVGGVAARAYGDAHDIHANVTIIGGSVGGVFGVYGGDEASGLHATGDVTALDGYAGGAIGSLLLGAEVSDSSAQGDVSAPMDAGGFVGTTTQGIVVRDTIATGMVSGGRSVGGFVGSHTDGTLERCAAKGDVFGNDGVGGFAGVSEGTIADAYSTGAVDITVDATTCRPADEVGGGFVGRSSGPISRVIAAPQDVNVGALEGFDIVGVNCDGSSPTGLSEVYVVPHVGAPAELVAHDDVSAAPESDASYPALDFGSTWVIPTTNPTHPQGLRLPVLQHECGGLGVECP